MFNFFALEEVCLGGAELRKNLLFLGFQSYQAQGTFGFLAAEIREKRSAAN